MSSPNSAELFPPGEFIRDELEERGWTQSDLATVMGRPLPTVNMIINGRKAITASTAVELAEAFGTSAELWMNLESKYRLSLENVGDSMIRERATLYDAAPVKEMQRRGWIEQTTDTNATKTALLEFFDTDSLDDIPGLKLPSPSNLKTAAGTGATTEREPGSAAERAWLFRGMQIAQAMPTPRFSKKRLTRAFSQLRGLLANPEEIRNVPKVLHESGIRFVALEHLARTALDGAVLWPSRTAPVLLMSLRHDRIDYFWHTLMHELAHIAHEDGAVVDVDLDKPARKPTRKLSAAERHADEQAANALVPRTKLNSFIRRVRPDFDKTRITKFAQTVGVHPGIIAGLLQFRGEIATAANREMLVKVRHILTTTAVTDGWGRTPSIA